MSHRISYSEKLKHPLWQKKRLEVMELAGFACLSCCDTEKTLHVHHRHYRRGLEPWEYDFRELECLCEDCHDATHAIKELINFFIGKLLHEDLPRVLGYVKGVESSYFPGIQVKIESYEEAVGVGEFFGNLGPDEILKALNEDNSITAESLWNLSHPKTSPNKGELTQECQ